MSGVTTPSSTYEAKWTAATRKAHQKSGGYFAGPHGSFPLSDCSDVGDAWGLAGHAANPDQVRANIKRWASSHGFTKCLPATAKEEDKPKENVALTTPSTTSFTPKPRIARVKVCFLEDGAISQNGRQYPKPAVDTLIRNAQADITDPGQPPLTCYISHAAADNDSTLELVGKLAQVWREGTKAMAYIDVPDTRAGRDIASLAAGGYLKTESLRAENAKITLDKQHGIPQVGGESLRLRGIDFTTTPGISQAQVQDVLLESGLLENQSLSEYFPLPSSALSLEEGVKGIDMDRTIQPTLDLEEAGGANMAANPGTSGDSPYMTSDSTDDSYHQRLYPTPSGGDPMMGVKPSVSLGDGMMGTEADGLREAVQHAHDHSATALNYPCAPAGGASEAGRSLSAKNAGHLHSMHEKAAHALGKACEGKYKPGGSAKDPDNDGDDDSTDDPKKNPDFALDNMQSKEARRPAVRQATTLKESHVTTYTPDQLAEALRKAGYEVKAPPTEEEKLQARLQEQEQKFNQQFAEMKALLEAAVKPAPTADVTEVPQRKSQVLGANVDANGGKPSYLSKGIYTHGAYLKEKIKSLDWNELADRTAPLPEGLNLEWLIQEFAQLRMGQYFDRYGWPDEG